MRLSSKGESAKDIVNYYSEQALSKIIWTYGEERFAQRIARFIVNHREKEPIRTTRQLAEIIKKAVPSRYWQKRLHPATRTFQALRIVVNNELSNLEIGVKKAIEMLSLYGRICVISYHSLEDRIVKQQFKFYEYRKDGTEGSIKILTKKPVKPSDEEIKKNRSARSAKLRAAEKIKREG